MSANWSDRYGDLVPIAEQTDHRCHLCGGDTLLEYFARPGTYGPHTVTVDHLVPQSHNGSDDLENLRLAHAHCNSIRGTRDAAKVREELSGDRAEPWSTSAVLATKTAGVVAVGWLAGEAFATVDQYGVRRFNWKAAILALALTGLLVYPRWSRHAAKAVRRRRRVRRSGRLAQGVS